ncbi:MAG: hypothetical protein Q7S70_02810 [bacterium]|nr:hypothetical protein [bacterium]
MQEPPIKSESGQLTRSCRVFASLNFFLLLSIFTLVFSNLLGLNLPKYYPLLYQWSVTPISGGVGMGYFAAVGFSLILALPLSFIFYLSLARAQKHLEIRYKTFKNLSTGFLLFGIFYFAAKEWKEWGIDKMGIKSTDFFGPEFWSFVVILGSFLALLKILLILEKKIFD